MDHENFLKMLLFRQIFQWFYTLLVNNFPIFNRVVPVYLLIIVWKVLKSSNHCNVYSCSMWKLKFHTTTLFCWKIESGNQLIIPCTSYLCIVIGLPIIFANFRIYQPISLQPIKSEDYYYPLCDHTNIKILLHFQNPFNLNK